MRKLLLLLALSFSSTTFAQTQQFTTEERFHDMFVTAGYGTAFGAALGAALLSFTGNPSEELRYVAVGASVGFITGSLYGGYVVFNSTSITRPTVDGLSATIDRRPQFEAGMTLAKF